MSCAACGVIRSSCTVAYVTSAHVESTLRLQRPVLPLRPSWSENCDGVRRVGPRTRSVSSAFPMVEKQLHELKAHANQSHETPAKNKQRNCTAHKRTETCSISLHRTLLLFQPATIQKSVQDESADARQDVTETVWVNVGRGSSSTKQ